MWLSAMRRRLTISVICLFLMLMSVPLTMASQTAFAQTKPGQCPQGKLCPLKITPHPTSAQGSSVTINPTQGIPGTQVVGTGNSWTSGDYILVQWDDGTNLANTTVQSNGTFTVSFTVPSNATPGNNYDVYFTDQTAGYFIPATFTVTTNTSPALTVTTVFTRDGNGNVSNTFAPGDAIQYVVYVNNSSSQAINATFNFQAWGPGNFSIYSEAFSIAVPVNLTGWYVQSTVPTNAPPGTYTIQVNVTDQNNSQDQSTGQGQFTVSSQSFNYDPGNYGGKSGFVSVSSYNEPNNYKHRNYCGPAASRVLISAWTNNVPTLSTLATEEKTSAKNGTLMSNMVRPINNAIGQKYYSIQYAGSQGAFSNMIGNDILGNNHPLITGILTIYGSNHLNGWSIKAKHIITIYGFDFTSPSVGYIYYYETGGTVAGTTATGSNSIDYNTFWTLVQQNNVQLA